MQYFKPESSNFTGFVDLKISNTKESLWLSMSQYQIKMLNTLRKICKNQEYDVYPYNDRIVGAIVANL